MSGDNPYSPPPVVTEPMLDDNRQHLRNIAAAQRLVNIAVLTYLCLIPINAVVSVFNEGAVWIVLVLAVLGLSVLVFCAIAVFRLASLFYGKLVGILYVLGLLIPCVGLILLVVLSQKATSLLKQNGIRVGLLGADPNAV